MTPLDLPGRYRVDEAEVAFQERALCVSAGRIGGLEIRPTRVFLWLGSRAAGRERMVPMDAPPRLLERGRRRHLDVGACHLSFLGNPAVTLSLFAARATRKALRSRTHRAPAA